MVGDHNGTLGLILEWNMMMNIFWMFIMARI
jgi:hypothetical protein